MRVWAVTAICAIGDRMVDGNVSEIEFYRAGVKAAGPGYGTPGSWNGSGATFGKALDGSAISFFDGPWRTAFTSASTPVLNRRRQAASLWRAEGCLASAQSELHSREQWALEIAGKHRLHATHSGALSPPEMQKLRLGVLGSGKGSNFRAIHEAIRAGRLDARVVIVCSDVVDAGILRLARDAGHCHRMDRGIAFQDASFD